MAEHNFEDGKRSLVLSDGEYAFYRDETSGIVHLLVGPKAYSPSSTDKPVKFTKHKGFTTCPMHESIQRNMMAPTGYYVTLLNPAVDGSHPSMGRGSTADVELDVGRKINIPGPCNFALWPMQMADLIRGHHLRSNQYLVIRINDEIAARANWTQTIVKETETVTAADGDGEGVDGGPYRSVAPPEKATTPKFNQVPDDLAVGKRYIIKGTEVGFYIPPTGVSVEKTSDDLYVRSALTLERLQYCILVDERGNKRYQKGPDVIFPTPTEQFVSINGKVRHDAIQLNPIQGLHIKVIADYEDGGIKYKSGEEIFVTGEDVSIYYPREEHAIQKYDGSHKHFATAVPPGQGRYVMQRLTGEIKVVPGPAMLLPDPRTEVFIRRALSDEQVKLWYPGNVARNDGALEYNRSIATLANNTPTTRSGAVSEGEFLRSSRLAPAGARRRSKGTEISDAVGGGAAEVVAYAASVDSVTAGPQFSNEMAMESSPHGNQSVRMADEIEHSSTYTQPRTLTLAGKHDGVPLIKPHTGYAVMVTDDSGKRRVAVGPTTVLMGYDESLQIIHLSTSTPKQSHRLLDAVYLQVKNNQVSDRVLVMSKDHVAVNFDLSFRVDFEGDPNKWFEVENYIKLLTDHVRSVLMGVAKRMLIAELYTNGVDIIRDSLLGASQMTEDGPSRVGMLFPENGMRVKDVEVLGINIQDAEVGRMLHTAQFETVKSNIDLERSRRHLIDVKEQESINRELESTRHMTKDHQRTLQIAALKRELEVSLTRIENSVTEYTKSLEMSQALDGKEQFEFEARLERDMSAAEQRAAIEKAGMDLRIQLIEAETRSTIERFKSITPEFAASLTTLSDNATIEALAKSTALMTQLGGKDIADVIGNAFQGIGLGSVVEKLGLTKLKNGNGANEQLRAPV